MQNDLDKGAKCTDKETESDEAMKRFGNPNAHPLVRVDARGGGVKAIYPQCPLQAHCNPLQPQTGPACADAQTQSLAPEPTLALRVQQEMNLRARRNECHEARTLPGRSLHLDARHR